jgi:hypothetical protein
MLTQKMFSDDKKILLNVGCGNRYVRQGWPYFESWKEIRADLYVEDADIKCDIVKLNGVTDSSVDCIWASHVVEHLYWHELPETFGNFMRVLKPNGCAVVIVPDLGAIADRIKDGLLEPVREYNNCNLAPIDFIFGGRDFHQRDGIGQLHKTGFTSKSMGQVLNSLGIKSYIRQQNFQVFAVCYKDEIDTEILNHI